ncbi:protein late bloomer [Drosophila sulfurigaster albostrigata]|uniref:protein late bloomer n=1 Tax=Drosophila nasuta TaxID=42062 RepID=UPI00295E2E6E|nr:protein late bloomer [Drosophila nasuta]XP_062132651.1 protein late bloomer [Drosophila sulfurigaster albostrigata]
MGCATATIKYLVFLFNALCALLGIGVIVVNSIALKDVANETRPVLIFFIVIGSIVFLISFFGCCGAIKESSCLTWMYAIIMLIILILSCVLCFVYVHHIDDEQLARSQLNNAWAQQKNGTDAMTFYQKTFKCCGITGPNDYTKANLTTPESCYAANTNGTATTSHSVYPDGCLTKLIAFYDDALKFVRVFGWILIAVEGAAFVFATVLGITFNNEQRRSRY